MAESSHSFLNVLDTPAWRFCTDKSHESCADTHIQRSCQRPRDNKLTNFHVVLLSIIYQKLKYEYSVDWFFIESVNLGLDKYRCLNCKHLYLALIRFHPFLCQLALCARAQILNNNEGAQNTYLFNAIRIDCCLWLQDANWLGLGHVLWHFSYLLCDEPMDGIESFNGALDQTDPLCGT